MNNYKTLLNPRRHFFDDSYMITDHPKWFNWDLVSQSERDFLVNNLKANYMNKTIFTISEATKIFSETLGEDYNFNPSNCKIDSFHDIRELFSIRGYSHDYWREDGPQRIPNDYLILDEQAPGGYYITQSGMEYILKHKFLFELTKSEKTCIEEYNY
jgi:hypothetical protein